MPQDSFYSSRPWRDAREKYLRSHPWCSVCLHIGIRSKAAEVDHIKPINAGGAPLDERNFDGRCKRHHSQKTRAFDTPSQPGRQRLVTTGADGWPVHIEEKIDGKYASRSRKVQHPTPAHDDEPS